MDLKTFANDPLAFFEALTIPSAHGPRRFSDCMAEFQRERFAGISDALVSIARGEKPGIGRHWWEATKGASKDSDLAACLLWLLAFSPRPLACQVGAADQDQAGELRKAARDILRLNPFLAGRLDIQAWKIVCAATGSECEIIAADTAGSHGARPDVLILNELSHVTKQEFAENLLDNAAKVPHGVVVIATNAGFLDSWQWKLRESVRSSPRWCFSAYTQPAPWLDAAEIEERRRSTSANRFARLWCGEWVADSGDALSREDIEAAVRAAAPMAGHEPGMTFIAGLDLGLSKDASALLAIGKQGGRYRLAHTQLWRPRPGQRVDLTAVEGAISEAHKRFRFHRLAFDPFQAELLAERLTKAGVPMERVPFSGANVSAMATTMLDVFTSGSIDLYPHPQLVQDLGRLRVKEMSYGLKLDSPRGPSGHGDLATALALALFAGKSVSAAVWAPAQPMHPDDLKRWGSVVDRAPAGVFLDVRRDSSDPRMHGQQQADTGSILDRLPPGVLRR